MDEKLSYSWNKRRGLQRGKGLGKDYCNYVNGHYLCVWCVWELYLRQGQFRTFSTKSLFKVIGRIELHKKVCRYIFFSYFKINKKNR